MIDVVGVIIVLKQVVSGMSESPELEIAVVRLEVLVDETRASSSEFEGI